jgi:hypothetical protein
MKTEKKSIKSRKKGLEKERLKEEATKWQN